MIRVLIADDHDIVREGLVRILALHKDIEVVAEASTGREAVRMCMDLANLARKHQLLEED